LKDTWDLVFMIEETAKMGRQIGWPATFLGEYMPKLTHEAMWQVVASDFVSIDWEKAEAAFRFEGWDAHAEDWLKGWTIKQLGDLAPRLACLDNLAQTRQVAGVLLHEDITNGANYVAQWARNHKIPCVHVAHGGYGMNWRPDVPVSWWDVHLSMNSDVVCCWNEGQAQSFLANGARPDQVVVTGPGIFDHWVKLARDTKFAREILGLEQNRPVVAWLGDFCIKNEPRGTDDRITSGFKTFLEAAKLLADWQVIVNPHPGMHVWNVQWHVDRMNEAGVHGIVVENNIELIAQAADVFYTATGSTVCIEASVLGTTTALPSDIAKGDPFYIGCDWRDPASIADAIRRAYGRATDLDWREARSKALVQLVGVPDGKATDRVMAVLRQRFSATATN